MPKLTKNLVERTQAGEKDTILRDSEIKGFICKITPKGKKVYMLYYRNKAGRERKPAIGYHGAITCEEARNIAKNWMFEVSQGRDPSEQKSQMKQAPSFEDVAIEFTTIIAPSYKKKSSLLIDKANLKHHILPSIGKIKINALTKEDIINLHRSLKGKPITANRCIALISKILNVAEEKGFRSENSNPCKYVQKYPENKRERFLSREEMARLKKTLKQEADKGIENKSALNAIWLLIYTGCRLSEILTLKWSYIDFEHNRINLPDSKTGKKSITLSEFTKQILLGIEKINNNPYVIVGLKDGSHLINLAKPWNRIRKKADLPDLRIHDLRHNFASFGAAAGLSLYEISYLLGHKNIKTTTRYTHLFDENLKVATNKISENINSFLESKKIVEEV